VSATLHVTWGPDTRKATGEHETHWCFKCRKRTEHEWFVAYDSQPSYYDPIASLICPSCGESHTYFPGCGPL
jgi:hypothetical protein